MHIYNLGIKPADHVQFNYYFFFGVKHVLHFFGSICATGPKAQRTHHPPELSGTRTVPKERKKKKGETRKAHLVIFKPGLVAHIVRP